ncbi:MAG: hypothetical protein MUE40_16715 [Anaerolineae bacterium]|jgi:hypothetical protein|nr:hypothetical protein [Anaerolineae bacterium]
MLPPPVPAPAARHPRLLAVCAILSVFQIINAVLVLQLPDAVSQRLSLPPGVQAALSLLWALLFAGSSGWLYRGPHRAARRVWWLLAGFALYSWLRLALFARADYDRDRLLFLAGLFIPGLLLFVWRMMRPAAGHPTAEGNVHDTSPD